MCKIATVNSHLEQNNFNMCQSQLDLPVVSYRILKCKETPIPIRTTEELSDLEKT